MLRLNDIEVEYKFEDGVSKSYSLLEGTIGLRSRGKRPVKAIVSIPSNLMVNSRDIHIYMSNFYNVVRPSLHPIKGKVVVIGDVPEWFTGLERFKEDKDGR